MRCPPIEWYEWQRDWKLEIMSKVPTLFIPHGGGPCFFMDWDPPDTWVRMAGTCAAYLLTLVPAPRP